MYRIMIHVALNFVPETRNNNHLNLYDYDICKVDERI